MKPLFLDAGYVIALEAADDQHHTTAIQGWHKLTQALPPLITTSYVFDEIVTFFNSRGRHDKAVEIGNRLLESAKIEVIQVNEDLFYAGWQFLQKHNDKNYSLTDCISFVVMKQHGVKSALTFDGHFVQAGFEKFLR